MDKELLDRIADRYDFAVEELLDTLELSVYDIVYAFEERIAEKLEDLDVHNPEESYSERLEDTKISEEDYEGSDQV